MKKLSGFLLILTLSASAAFAQTASNESANSGMTRIALQKTENGYQLQSVEQSVSATSAKESDATPVAAPAADAPASPAVKACCSKKGSSASAAACSGKEAEASKAACTGHDAKASAAGSEAKPACCANGKHPN